RRRGGPGGGAHAVCRRDPRGERPVGRLPGRLPRGWPPHLHGSRRGDTAVSRRHRGATIALAASLVLGAGWQPAARQTFRSGVDAVQIDVLVTDGSRPLAGLSTDDFELRDNGVVQQIDAAALGDVPVTLMLVLDVSESVKGEPLQHLRAAI